MSLTRKTILLLCLTALFFTANAGQPPASTQTPPHVEFKYYGFYCVIDYTHIMHFAVENGSYMDLNGNMHHFPDKYNLSGVTAIAGWQFGKESGVGVGFSYLNDPTGAFSQIPVFFEYRSHYLRNRVTPFTSLQMGYSIPFGSKNLEEEYTRIEKGGLTFGFSAGVRFAISQKLGLNASVGYQLIHLNSVERGFNTVAVSRMSELYHNLKFGFGIVF